MGYRYIAFVSSPGIETPGSAPSMHVQVAAAGLRARYMSATLVVFASDDTPTLMLPDGGIVIGHVFTENGNPFDDRMAILCGGGTASFRPMLIRKCWGEYLLIEPSTRATEAWAVTRDPSGGMRCLYAKSDSATYLTSDIALPIALCLQDRRIHWDHIGYRLAYPHLPTSHTAFTGVQELLAGTTLYVNDSQVEVDQTWTPWSFVTDDQHFLDIEEASTAVRNAVSKVVRTWAETDGSILLELSGGLDSSIVAASLKGATADVACCNVVTPVPGADERKYAQLVADDLNFSLTTEVLDFDAARFDAPPPHDAATPRVAALQHAANAVFEATGDRLGVTCFFSGGGGDSVFAYLRSAAPAADAFKAQGVCAGVTAIHDLADLHQCTVWKAARLTLRKLMRRPRGLQPANHMFLSAGATPAPDTHPWLAAPAGALPGDRERIFVMTGAQTFRDAAPRGRARWMRMPLISQPVMEACLRTPSWMWITDGLNRAVARRAFATDLPREVFNRRSKGSFMPYTGAVYRRKRAQIRDFLLSGQLEARGLLDGAALRRFLDEDLAPRDESFMRIFELCMIESWVRHQAP
ncbi:asparagine synthase C-terminal domain-containing protein [Luteimonas sp. XNQY3]|nr:asparagine synthase-related protein [Luteimonas sp. XNQY3]MCD9008116.1 asparagine synthase C-terminal domain-containing protein [Luteimonas sp. XNQY3]